MITPIQTTYMGYRFRSRLEARWAVFFETCSFDWVYEKEGYNLPNVGPYLPDFWIDNLKLWVEIKPDNSINLEKHWHFADQPELERVFTLQQETGYPACLIEGTPGKEKIYFFAEETTDSSGGQTYTDEAEWVSCNGMITLDLHRGRDSTIYTIDYNQALPWFTYSQEEPTFKIPVQIAYQAARSARFEHGANKYACNSNAEASSETKSSNPVQVPGYHIGKT